MTLKPGAYTPEQVSEAHHGQPHGGSLLSAAVAVDTWREPCPVCPSAVVSTEGENGALRALLDHLAQEHDVRRQEPWVGFPADWTDEQVAEFSEKLNVAMYPNWGPKFVPPRPLLTPETARELLRECVTIVKPGEVLVIRTPDDWTPQQIEQWQEFIDEGLKYRQLDVAVLFLPGEEFAVAAQNAAPVGQEAPR